MHEETYLAFFTPRDEEPSLSSSEETSSEFDLLEIKIQRKQKYIWKTEQVLCRYITYTKGCLWEQAPERLIFSCKENYKLYIRGYSPFCSYLKTKESYDRWVTKRVWGFKHQISKAKYLKKLVRNIRKLQEKFRCTVQNGDLVVNIIRVCFLIVGVNGSGKSRVSDEPSYPGNLNYRLRMLSG